MWRTLKQRQASAGERLALADALWGWRPHPAQKRFFDCPAQVRVAACGRRWGKTEALSVDVATLALTEARRGRDCRQLVVAPTDAQARLLGAEILAKVRQAFDEGAGDENGSLSLDVGSLTLDVGSLSLDVRQRPALQITIAPVGVDLKAAKNDKKARGKGAALSRILCRTAGRDGRSLRGLWAHRLIVDEAGYVPDGVITEVLLPMLADVGGELVMASSPAGRRSAYYRAFVKGEALGGQRDEHGISYASFQCPSTDNPHLDHAFLEAMRDELGEHQYAQEFLAQFVDDYGAVFRADDIDGCLETNALVSLVSGDLVSLPQPGHLYAAGLDWGRRQDYTVAAILDCTERPARLVRLIRRQGQSWEAQTREVAQLMSDFNPVKLWADGTSIGDVLAETLQDEIRRQAEANKADRVVPVARFWFGAETKLKLIDHLTVGLSGRSLRYPSHKTLLTELRGFEYGASGSTGRATMAARGSGHDDTVCALALAWWGAPDAAAPPPARRVFLGSQWRG
jgi:hypothetical protein